MKFIVKHTARDTEYEVTNFVDKNKDEVSPFMHSAMTTCEASIYGIFS